MRVGAAYSFRGVYVNCARGGTCPATKPYREPAFACHSAAGGGGSAFRRLHDGGVAAVLRAAQCINAVLAFLLPTCMQRCNTTNPVIDAAVGGAQ